MITAIIGVVGTLMGVVLGWLLNCLSKKGKLNFYIKSFSDSFYCSDGEGGRIKSCNKETTESYHYKLIFDLYNSSSETKAIHDLKIAFLNGKEELYVSIPIKSPFKQDDSIEQYDKTVIINIPPKTLIKVCLVGDEFIKNKKTPFIWRTNEVNLIYYNEKNKLKKVNIKSENYCDYFENHKTEENENEKR